MAEVKLTKNELIKQAKDGLDIYDDIFRFAELGYKAITEDDFVRLRWFGIYQQRPNEGHFMVRIKIPGGQVTPAQLRVIAELARTCGNGFADITTRQDIQLHWLTVTDLPVMIRELDKVGMYLNFACGDTPRNVVACPLAGLMKDELFDCSHLPAKISLMFKDGAKEFSNLPRKFKMSISACPIHCTVPQIHCLSLFGVKRVRNGAEQPGFGVMVGGGLRDTPHWGQSLRVFIPHDREDVIMDVYRKVGHIFRDADQLRRNRLKARLKFLVADIGWQAFRDRLEQYLGYQLEHDDSIAYPTDASLHDHLGVGELKNGTNYVGIPVPRGRVPSEILVAWADLLDQHAPGTSGPGGAIRLTAKQNAILVNIPNQATSDAVRRLSELGYSPFAHALRGSLISCTGIQFCNLAIVETKERAADILRHLEATTELDEPLAIHISGCPNSCAQYQVCDIGLTGINMRWHGVTKQPGFSVLVGSRVGENPEFGEVVTDSAGKKFKLPSDQVHLALEQLIKAYLANRADEHETFAEFSRRVDMLSLIDWLTTPAMKQEAELVAATAGAGAEE